MKPLVGLLAAALLLPGSAAAGPAPGKPMRVMSINLCGDQFVMLLLPPERINSVTYLARDGSATPDLQAQARRTRINHGLAEEVLAEKPDLIVGSRFTSPATRRLVKTLNIPLIELDSTDGFDDTRAQLRLLGAAFGERARAEAWIARMDTTLAELARTAPKRRIVAMGWDSSGRVPGQRSMFNDVLRAAGADNLAADKGVFERTLDIEQLVRLKPQPEILLYATSERTKVGERVNLQQHPALVRAYGARRLAYPQNSVTCGTPYAADAAVQLRKAMLAAIAVPKGAR